MPKMDLTIEERVDAGIRLLDEKSPHWRNFLSPATLNVAHIFDCPLARIFSCYGSGLTVLGITGMEAPRYGFEVDHYSQNQVADNDALNAEWRKRLT